jgi:aminoglycoside phosphotransferase (APT) family kinase protein
MSGGSRPTIHKWQGTGRSWTASIGPASRPGRPDVVVKFVTGDNCAGDRTRRAAREYGALALASGEFSARDELTVPQPIALYPDAAAIVMTYSDGLCLTKYLSRASAAFSTRRRLQECDEAITRCAHWLRSARQIDVGASDIQSLRHEHIRSMGARLDLARTHRLLPVATIERLFERYVADSGSVPWESLDTGFVHHDFGSHNILVTERGICVIDFGDARYDFVLQDVSRLWLELSVIAASRTFCADRRFTMELRDRFLDACGLDAVQRSVGLFAVNAALARLISCHVRQTGRMWQRWSHQMVRYLQRWLEDHAVNGVLA